MPSSSLVPYGEYIPEEMKEQIATLQKAGVRVVRVGYQDKTAVALSDLGNVLQSYQAIELSCEQPDLVVGEYIKDGKMYLMMTNEHIGRAINTTIHFKKSGNVYCYDAMEDVVFKPSINEKGYQLSLQPYESIIWVISDEEINAKAYPKDLDDVVHRATFASEWKVQYADSFAYPKWQKNVPIKSLGLISNIESWENVSGTVRYSSTFTGEICRQAILKLGEVYETAEVFINGQSAGVRICKPYEFDISNLIRDGENEIAIEVTNTLGTTVRDAISHYLMIEPFGLTDDIIIEMKGR